MNDAALWQVIATHVLILTNPLLLGFIFVRLGKLGERLTAMENRITNLECKLC